MIELNYLSTVFTAYQGMLIDNEKIRLSIFNVQPFKVSKCHIRNNGNAQLKKSQGLGGSKVMAIQDFFSWPTM